MILVDLFAEYGAKNFRKALKSEETQIVKELARRTGGDIRNTSMRRTGEKGISG